MASEHVKFYDGPENLTEAAYYVLNHSDDVDFAVVPGFADRTDGHMFSGIAEARAAIPELIDTERTINDWWNENSIPGLAIAPETLYTGFGVFSNVRTHIDGPQRVTVDGENVVSYLGPLTMTFVHRLDSTTTVSRFSAEDTGLPFNPREMSWEHYRDLYFDTLFGCQETNTRPLRSAHDQSVGDVTLFRNTPNQTMHRVELLHNSDRANRMAQVISSHLVQIG